MSAREENPRRSSSSGREHSSSRPRPHSPVKRQASPEKRSPKLQLVPEFVDKRTYEKGKTNPKYLRAGSLYIPKNIIDLVTNETIIDARGEVKTESVFAAYPSKEKDEQWIQIKDPELRRYIERIVQYSEYSLPETLPVVRKAALEVKQIAKGAIAERESSPSRKPSVFSRVLGRLSRDSSP